MKHAMVLVTANDGSLVMINMVTGSAQICSAVEKEGGEFQDVSEDAFLPKSGSKALADLVGKLQRILVQRGDFGLGRRYEIGGGLLGRPDGHLGDK